MAHVTTDRSTRARDLRVLAATAALVIAAGSLIAWGMTRIGGKGAVECGARSLGDSGAIRNDPDLVLTPAYRTFGGGCDLWLVLDGDTLVAVRGHQRLLSCTVRARPSKADPTIEEFRCGDKAVPLPDLEIWPLSVRTLREVDNVLVVDFGTSS